MKREVIELPATKDVDDKAIHRQLRVAAYCRVSTNQEMQQNSYHAQKEYYANRIASNPDWILADIFADEAVTGTSAKKRRDFQRMITWCKKGKIDLIITKSISRFARNTLDCLYYVRYLQQLGIPVIFETEQIDTSKMDSELVLTLLGAASQAESEAASSRVKWGVREAFRNGKVQYYYKHWLGYKKGTDGEPEIIPEEAAVVRRIFDAYINGDSLRDIRNALESEQVPTKNIGTPWSISMIRGILQNERYTGDVLLQKTYTTDPITKKQKKNTGELPQYLVRNCHPAIISRETFELVNAEIKRRGVAGTKIGTRGVPGQAETYSSKYALSELLVCGECNTLYRRCVWKKRDKSRTVWRCRNRLSYGTKYCKKSPSLDETLLYDVLVKVINQQLYRPEYLLAPFERPLLETQSPGIPSPAKSWQELYVNLRREQAHIDCEFIDLVTQYAGEKSWDEKVDQFQNLLERRRECDTYLDTLALRQYEEAYRQNSYRLPFQLSEFNDVVARHIFDTIKVLDSTRLLITFKSGEQVEIDLSAEEAVQK